MGDERDKSSMLYGIWRVESNSKKMDIKSQYSTNDYYTN